MLEGGVYGEGREWTGKEGQEAKQPGAHDGVGVTTDAPAGYFHSDGAQHRPHFPLGCNSREFALGGTDMIQKLDSVIRKHPFFRGMTDKQLKVIEGCAKNARFTEGKTIFVEGDPADAFYFIEDGSVSIELTMPNHPRSSVQTVGTGDILGWSWVSPPYHWHFNARALKATRAIAFDARCLRSKLEKDHELGYELLKRFSEVIVERLDATQVQLLKLTKES